jgi:NitT/TauT family transport system substrate-binding protein
MDRFNSIRLPDKSRAHDSPATGSIWTFRRYGIGQLVALGLLVAGILLLAVGSFGAVFVTQPTLRLGTNLWIGYQPLQIARDANRLSDKVVLMESRSASTVIEAMRIGTIDAAALTLDETIRIANSGIPVSIALVFDVSNGADVVLARTPQLAAAGPRGRRIGVETEAVGAYLLHRWLDRLGIPLSAIEVVDAPAAIHHRAFADLDVDFLVTFEPLASSDFAGAATRVFDSSEIPGEIVDVLAIRQDRIDAQRANLRHVVDGWFSGLEILDTRFADGVARMARHQDIGPDEVRLMLSRLRFPDRAANERMFRGGELERSIESIRKWLATEIPVGPSHANLGYAPFALEKR